MVENEEVGGVTKKRNYKSAIIFLVATVILFTIVSIYLVLRQDEKGPVKKVLIKKELEPIDFDTATTSEQMEDGLLDAYTDTKEEGDFYSTSLEALTALNLKVTALSKNFDLKTNAFYSAIEQSGNDCINVINELSTTRNPSNIVAVVKNEPGKEKAKNTPVDAEINRSLKNINKTYANQNKAIEGILKTLKSQAKLLSRTTSDIKNIKGLVSQAMFKKDEKTSIIDVPPPQDNDNPVDSIYGKFDQKLKDLNSDWSLKNINKTYTNQNIAIEGILKTLKIQAELLSKTSSDIKKIKGLTSQAMFKKDEKASIIDVPPPQDNTDLVDSIDSKFDQRLKKLNIDGSLENINKTYTNQNLATEFILKTLKTQAELLSKTNSDIKKIKGLVSQSMFKKDEKAAIIDVPPPEDNTDLVDSIDSKFDQRLKKLNIDGSLENINKTYTNQNKAIEFIKKTLKTQAELLSKTSSDIKKIKGLASQSMFKKDEKASIIDVPPPQDNTDLVDSIDSKFDQRLKKHNFEQLRSFEKILASANGDLLVKLTSLLTEAIETKVKTISESNVETKPLVITKEEPKQSVKDVPQVDKQEGGIESFNIEAE
jgi:hypothetical protein